MWRWLFWRPLAWTYWLGVRLFGRRAWVNSRAFLAGHGLTDGPVWARDKSVEDALDP